MHANGREVTTKDISGVHRGMSRKLNDCFHQYASVGLTQHSKKFEQMYAETNTACGSAGNEACTLYFKFPRPHISRNLEIFQ